MSQYDRSNSARHSRLYRSDAIRRTAESRIFRFALTTDAPEIEWQMPWGGIHDLHVLKNGHVMVQRGRSEVVEIDPKTKKVVWTFDRHADFGNNVSNSLLMDVVGKTIR